LIATPDVPASVAARKLKPKPSRHRFEKPIHNVKKPTARLRAAGPLLGAADLVLHHLDNGSAFRKRFHRLAHRFHIPPKKDGGAYRDRTDDLKLAKLALSQLS
jgi:hypothetical protein